MDKFVANFCNMPHSVTGEKPSKLLFNQDVADRKNKTKLVEIKIGDWAYRRELAPSTIKGPWESDPFRIVHMENNRVTGERDSQRSV